MGSEIDHHFNLIDSVQENLARATAITDAYIAMMFASVALDRSLVEASWLAVKESRELIRRVNRQISLD